MAATAKHFPGLGTARLSTDTNHVLLTTAAPALDRRLVPFARAIDAGVKVVMVSNAGYSAYDPTGVPAVISRPIVTGLLRERLWVKFFPGRAKVVHVTAAVRGVDRLIATTKGLDVVIGAWTTRIAGVRFPSKQHSPQRSPAMLATACQGTAGVRKLARKRCSSERNATLADRDCPLLGLVA